MKLPLRLPCVGLLLTAQSLVIAEDNWTRFRGPDGSGVSSIKGLPTKIEDKLFAWTVKLGTGHSCPVVFGKKLFLTMANEEKESRDLVCLGTDDGKEIWRKTFPYKTYGKHKLNSFASTTPAVDAKAVYVFWGETEKSEVAAFAHNGQELWRTPTGPYHSQHGSGMGLVAEGDVLILPKENISGDSFVAGLDTATGKILWKSETPGELLKTDKQGGGDLVPYTTPTILRRDGKSEAVFCNTKKGVYSLDVKTGAKNWSFDPKFSLRCIASPVVMGDLMFVSCGQGDSGKDSAVFTIPAPGQEPKEIYRARKGLPYVPTPIYLNGLLFVLSDTGVVTCVEPKTGNEVWKERVLGGCYASPVAANGVIYLFSRQGEVAVIEAGPAYKKISEGNLGEGVNATPAMGDGKFFLRTDSRLLCLMGAS